MVSGCLRPVLSSGEPSVQKRQGLKHLRLKLKQETGDKISLCPMKGHIFFPLYDILIEQLSTKETVTTNLWT
jgi:hypothetical protein